MVATSSPATVFRCGSAWIFKWGFSVGVGDSVFSDADDEGWSVSFASGRVSLMEMDESGSDMVREKEVSVKIVKSREREAAFFGWFF